MSLEIRILSGARAGQQLTLTTARATIGRHPSSDVAFDAHLDRDVSTRHAELTLANGEWTIRDLGSTNGTFVNGEPVVTRALQDGDVIAFGSEGPRAEVHLLPDVIAATTARPSVGRGPADGAGRASARAAIPATPAGESTTERIALAVRHETRSLRTLLIAAMALLVAGVAAAMWYNLRTASRNDALIAALSARNDSLASAIQRSTSAVKGMEEAIAAAQRQAAEIQSRLRTARGDQVAVLSRELSSLEQRSQALLTGNYPLVDSLNRRAIVMLAVEKADGKLEGGSGFSVSRDGHIVTNRHVLLDAAGGRPKRIAVIFNDTREWRPASLVSTAVDADLALLKMDVADEYPTVAAIAPSASAVRVGSPVAMIGFPLSLDTPQGKAGATGFTAASTLGPGTVSKLLEDVVQIDAFASTGSSGSALFDGRGRLIGVIYGGARDTHGRIVYAVPSEKVLALLPPALARTLAR